MAEDIQMAGGQPINNDIGDQVQPPPVQCVDNAVGHGVKVYADKMFYHTPIPQVPVQCTDSSDGPIVVYYDKTFYRSPQSQEYEENDHRLVSAKEHFSE